MSVTAQATANPKLLPKKRYFSVLDTFQFATGVAILNLFPGTPVIPERDTSPRETRNGSMGYSVGKPDQARLTEVLNQGYCFHSECSHPDRSFFGELELMQ